MAREAEKAAKKKAAKKLTQKAERAHRGLVAVQHPGLEFSSRHHVFIAKLKRGELWALNHLLSTQKGSVVSIILCKRSG